LISPATNRVKRVTSAARSHTRAFLANRSGNALVEFAFMAPFLLFLLAGAINLGLVIEQNIRVASAARAAAQYGTHSMARSYDTNGIVMAARSDANDSQSALSVAPGRYCTCPETGDEVTCTTSCTGSEAPQAHVSVTVERELAYLLPVPGFGGSVTLSHTVDMRVR